MSKQVTGVAIRLVKLNDTTSENTELVVDMLVFANTPDVLGCRTWAVASVEKRIKRSGLNFI